MRIALLVYLAFLIGSTIFRLVNKDDATGLDDSTTGIITPATDPSTGGTLPAGGGATPAPVDPATDPVVTTLADTVLASRESMYGKFVAVMWSGLENDPRSDSAAQRLSVQLATFGSRFTDPLVGLNGNDFRSLRDGTIAVALPGPFRSAREAADWCALAGLTSDNECFGVVLSDDHNYDERGDNVRVYPTQR